MLSNKLGGISLGKIKTVEVTLGRSSLDFKSAVSDS